MSPTFGGHDETRREFEQLVTAHYPSLYRFALSLTHSESDACDLTQQTFWIWGSKGHELRDRSRAKSWLFTTLHREFLRQRRRQNRFPRVELSEAEAELPTIEPETQEILRVEAVLAALAQVDPTYRAALSLFYLEEMSYREIAEVLGVPIGTVQSRLSRGKTQLRQLIESGTTAAMQDVP